jgi:hypothetical protein
MNNLKYLSWECPRHNSKLTLNELLAKSPQLKSLEISIQNITSTTLALISNNKNLTSLTITQCTGSFTPGQIQFIKLPYIKTINSVKVMLFRMPVEQLIQSCPNLEELIYSPAIEFPSQIHTHINNLKSLKRLLIFDFEFLGYVFNKSAPFPDSNLEYIELHIKTLDCFKIGIFSNLSRLKSVRIIYSSYYFPSGFDMRHYFDMIRNWRALYYYNVVHLRRIDNV